MYSEMPDDLLPQKPKIVLAEDMRIGNLVLVKRNGRDPNGKAIWKCRCLACGKPDANIRADNIKAGRTKSCGCLRHATTTGRRNQMSAVKPATGVLTRFKVLGYFAPPRKVYTATSDTKTKKRAYAFCYASVFVLDPAHPDFYNGDMTMYYTTVPGQHVVVSGNQNSLLGAVMRKMRDKRWVSPRGNAPSFKRWAEIEGVTFDPRRVPTMEDLFAQQKQMSQAAHPKLRGKTI